MKECGITPETIYIGGGTPTTLRADQLKALIEQIKNFFDLSKLKEFTIEAGRPDTITDEKTRDNQKAGYPANQHQPPVHETAYTGLDRTQP